jgi:molybdopterin-guanine dinucleotide biosynthesis protein MobB
MAEFEVGALPLIVSVVGRKNSGKTTLLVQLAAELRLGGVRVASIKHSHHEFDIDVPGKDSWRHFHEGEVEAVVVASPTRLAMVARADAADRDPVELVRRFLQGKRYDVVLVEAFKLAPLPKIEIFRRAVNAAPLGADEFGEAGAGLHLAMVTDAPEVVGDAPFPVIPLTADGAHVAAVADLLLELLRSPRGGSHVAAAGVDLRPPVQRKETEPEEPPMTNPQPPVQFQQLTDRFPELASAYAEYGRAATEAGPLEARMAHLVKLGISIGMRHEGAVHAHTRKALAAGFSPDELRHAALLAAPTLGWPAMMAAYLWVEDELSAAGAARTVTTEGMT